MEAPLGLTIYLYRGGGFPKLGVPFEGPSNKVKIFLGSMLGFLYFGKLRYGLFGNIALNPKPCGEARLC